MKLKHAFWIITLLFTFTGLQAQTKAEEQEVLQVVDSFMQAIDDKDTATFNSLFIDDAVAFRIQEGKIVTRALKMQADFPADAQWKERLRKPEMTVELHNQVATIAAPYDFWINGEFSHCGYETFTLLKSKKSWKIASLTFSVDKEGCE